MRKQRHEWYQSTTHVTVEFFVKNAKKENVTCEFREDHVSIDIFFFFI